MNDNLLTLLTNYQPSCSPTKIVHLPERVQGEEEREDWNSKNVKDHPSNHIPSHSEDEDEGLETIDRREHDY